MIKILIKIDIEGTYLNIIKLKSFYIVKEIIEKMKKTYRMGENICKWYDQQGSNIQNM